MKVKVTIFLFLGRCRGRTEKGSKEMDTWTTHTQVINTSPDYLSSFQRNKTSEFKEYTQTFLFQEREAYQK